MQGLTLPGPLVNSAESGTSLAYAEPPWQRTVKTADEAHRRHLATRRQKSGIGAGA